jgi:enamine deaminase RidA (YjgF/YER057c/UK114 family)
MRTRPGADAWSDHRSSEEHTVTDRELVTFGESVEQRYGFAQAVKVGDTIYVSGQTGWDGPDRAMGDVGTQMRTAYARIARALESCGATLADVVDETLFVADYAGAARVAGTVRHEVYGGPPAVASTMIPVAPFGPGEMCIEIKCVARV